MAPRLVNCRRYDCIYNNAKEGCGVHELDISRELKCFSWCDIDEYNNSSAQTKKWLNQKGRTLL